MKKYWRGAEFNALVVARAKAKLEESLVILETEAKRLCPVDTGVLQNSITHERHGLRGRVGTNVIYGLFQEVGYKHWKSGQFIQNPYLLPALKSKTNEIQAIWKRL